MKHEELHLSLSQMETKLNQKIGARDSLNSRIESVSNEIQDLDSDILSTEKAVWLLQTYAEDQQKILTSRIEGIVTKGLRAVFQDPTLEFKLTYSQTKSGDKKRTPEVAMSVLYEHNGQMQEGDINDSFGGGLGVVVAVLLRVVITLHLNPRVAPIIFWDEPLKDLSPSYEGHGDRISNEYRIRMADFLRSLVDETDLQIIVVSHEPEYAKAADINHIFSGGINKPSTVKTVKRKVYEELEEM